MDKYTNTVHGLLKEPLMSEPDEQIGGVEMYARKYEAYLKTAIPKAEGFDEKIPLDTGGLIDGIDFKVFRYNTDAPGEPDIVAEPLVDMNKETKQSAWVKVEAKPIVRRRAFSWYKKNGIFWMRLFGYGFYVKDKRRAKLYFSERNEITGKIIRNYYVCWLKPFA